MFLILIVTHFFAFQTPIDTSTTNEPTIHSILSESQRIELLESHEVVHQIERNFTVLSYEGLVHAFTSVGYDQLTKIESIEIEITDPENGKTLQKAKIRDMEDVAMYSRSSIFDDNRLKYYEVKSSKFPVQVTVKIQTKSTTNFQLPDWEPVRRSNQKVTKSTLTVAYPNAIGLRYKPLNLLGERSEKTVGNNMEVTWTETDLPVQNPDAEKEDNHKLLLAPVHFATGDYNGKMDDWSGLAAWQYKLNKDRKNLPGNFKSKLMEMTVDAESDYEKIQILYDYLQKNYRYVSIQLGIGGWQSMTAADVVKYAYGDCKGLTTLMQAMLKTVGIDSNYTLVFAGKDADDIETDFPSNQFNHVILQVPMPAPASPVWLECTSNSWPAGFLGDFTRNRHVLVINETGGYLTKTPAYNTPTWNSIHSKNEVKITKEGNASISSNIQAVGNFAENMVMVKHYLDARQQRDYFNRNSPVAGLIINEYDLKVVREDSLLIADLSYDGFIQKFVLNTSKRLILKPFLGKVTTEMLVNNALNQVDEYIIELPDAMEAENLLPVQNFTEDGIKVSLETSLKGEILHVSRSINLTLNDSITEDAKKNLLKRINDLGSTNFNFIKKTTALNE